MWYPVQRCIRCLIIICHFPQKSPIISAFFGVRVSCDIGYQKCIESLIMTGNFPQKSPLISVFFEKRDLQLKASYVSSPPCIFATLYRVAKLHHPVRVAKLHRMPYSAGLFSQKRQIIGPF